MPAIISELRDLQDLRELEHLFAQVWERPDHPPISSDTLTALAHSGNYVVGARDGARLMGGLVGWLGGVPPDSLHVHSHILGVVAEARATGLGFDLKQHQRRWCLERGVRVIEWTFDPLVRRNAYFNLTKLGAQASEYMVNLYGEMSDGINVGEESDRLVISWNLESAEAESAAKGQRFEPAVDDLQKKGASVLLSVGDAGEPVMGRPSTGTMLCEVPDDIVAVRRSNPHLAHSWRIAVRQAMGDALAGSHRISGATRSGWYVLEPRR